MALSRLQNFINDPTYTKIFVDPNNFDATDSIENRGTSPARPFISIQRAAIEAALSSYQPGRNNDRNDRTTIVVASGTHYIDNRPGFSIQNINGSAVFKKRTAKETWTTTTLNPFGESTNFDIFDANNDLYKYNSVNGGVILPRGTSIVGQDLRKTKIKPLYVPDPLSADVESSSIFNVTGSCYFSQFTFFDADTTKFSYKNYSDTKHVPKYSHHKLTSFVYADGVTPVRLGTDQTSLTDLQMYYYKITKAYDSLSGRGLEDFPANIDFEPNVNEFRIVGPLQENPLGIVNIRAGNGDGTGDNSIITVTTADLQSKTEKPHNFTPDTSIIIRGITQSPNSYNGSFTVREVVGINTFTYVTTVVPSEVQPSSETFDIATVSVESDTVSSASPYIFNCSIRSVYGMNGMWADGAKADGFKSMVVAQFTGISLQKDNDSYIIYDNGVYYDNLTLPAGSSLRPLYQNSRAIFKPDFENYHIRASNDAFIQAVSIFAIGYSKHFITESGADMSITNSNSNFGANALNSVGFRKLSFDRDDVGYITHIIPPKELGTVENDISWLPLDITKTKAVANPKKLFIYGYDNKDVIPLVQVDDYRVGARAGDKLYLTIAAVESQTTYSSPIYMTTPDESEGIISKKEYKVSRIGLINNISLNILTLTANHKLFGGEKIRLFSDNAQAPDGLDVDKVYYAITQSIDGTLGSNQIKLASTLNDALSNIFINGIGNNGGNITVVSSVSDKDAGEFGHPVQWDSANNNWYIFTASSTINQLYSTISTINTATFGESTPLSFIKRLPENRSIEDRLYKFRYVIPKEYINAKSPQVGYILQESKNVAISTVSINDGTSLTNSTELRNEKVIINATVGSILNNQQVVTITTELPHNFIPNDVVKIQGIRSSNNSTGVGIVSTYNGEYKVQSVPSSRTFTYTLEGVKTNPGTFTNVVNQRSTRQQRDLIPLVSRQSYKNNFYIYKVDTINEHKPGNEGRDGVYHLTILSSTIGIKNNVGFGLSTKYFNQDIKNLYPQVDRDNPISNPNASISYADLRVVGNIITDDKKKSLTLEAVNEFNKNTRIGFGITNVTISGIGSTTLTIFTDVEHKLNSIRSVSFTSQGSGYDASATVYSANLVDSNLSEEDATCKYSTTSGGQINTTSLRLNDVGSAHTVGETLQIPGGTSNAILQVTQINNNIGDVLELSGFQSTDLNGIYEIVAIPNKKSIQVHIPVGLSTYTSNTNDSLPLGYIASKGIGITTSKLANLSTGIVTFTTSYPHGLSIGNKFKIVGTDVPQFNNKNYIVNSIVGISTFTINVGIATTTRTPAVGKILKYGINSNFANLGVGEENLSSRASHIYSGLSAVLTSSINTNTLTLNVDNANGFKRGDFILVNSEIMRIRSTPVGNSFNVLRNQLGTIRLTAVSSGEVVRKIKVLPIETRRPSFMRASGHTFEYLGFGPGNYSTALPQRQDRILTPVEVLISQAKKEQGGNIVYTGMNDLGEFYTGSTKVSATTGEQTIIGAPVLTYTGDDANGEIQDNQSGSFDELLIKKRITVEGGDGNNQSSQFNGPVNFTNRVTNLSPKGLLLKNLFVKGSTSQEKLFTVGISTPTTSTIADPLNGDISFISNPTNNYIGHVYKNNEWRQWGLISNEPNKLSFTVDKIGIGTAPNDVYPLNVIGGAQFQNLRVTGQLIVEQPQTLSDVTFEDITIYGTSTFVGTNLLGVGVTYTQIHERGISRLNNLEVVGVSTFNKNVYINQPDQFGNIPTLYVDKLDLRNIRVGIANSNTIDTKFGDLVLDAASDNTVINSNLSVSGSRVAITSSQNLGIPGIGIVTAYIDNSSSIRLGVGNHNQESFIDFNNDTTTFPDFGLRLIRNSGSGNQSSALIHRGTEPLLINAINSADVRILSNNTERIRVGLGGTITTFQNNSGTETKGSHLRLTQNGPGDVALSWDITHNNANRRWYAGIDTSDGYSWKLANPLITVPYGSENFDIDTKLKVDTSGNTTIFGGLSLNGGLTINTNKLTVNGTTGNTAIAGSLNIGGAFSLTTSGINRFSVDANGNVINSGTLTSGKLKTSGDLEVDGAATIGTTLGVIGQITSSSFKIKDATNEALLLRATGVAKSLTKTELDAAAGFVIQPPVTSSTLPNGNSVQLQPLTFNGSTRTFPLKTIDNISFTPISAANLLVSVGGIIQRADTDYVVSGSDITFPTSSWTSPPTSDLPCFIIAFGGLGGLTQNYDWGLNSKGQILVGSATQNTAIKLGVGGDNTVLTADSSTASGVAWKSIPKDDILTNTVWDAKGDLIVGKGNDSAVKLGIGGDNTVLTADSSTASGVAWKSSAAFPAGTLMLFQQTTAPTGWTKQTTHNNKALRVVSGNAGSGGSASFTDVFASRTPSGTVNVSGTNSGGSVQGHTLTTSQIPQHYHAVGFAVYVAAATSGAWALGAGSAFESGTKKNSDGMLGSSGGGSHSHGFTNPTWTMASSSFTGSAMDFAVQYVDLIIAAKD